MKYFLIALILISLVAGCDEGRTTTNQERDDATHDVSHSDTRDGGADAASSQPDTRADEGRDDAEGAEDPLDAQVDDAATADADARAEEEEPDTHSPSEPDEPTGPFVIWMAPDGSDTRDGSSPGASILTLNRAQQLLEASAPETDVEVRIAPGRYRGQKVSWTFSVPEHTVTFTRVAGADERPVFDGCLSDDNCPGGTWFMLRRSDGAQTGIIFNYLRIQNYQTAISLNGSRNAEASSNGSNRIFGCYFYRIGNIFNAAVEPSTAAVRLVNSDDNEIINNHFVDIINTRSPALLHAIYIAHMSDRNQILRNSFRNNAGDPIRVRDYSNDNIINENTFKKAALSAAYSEWYCDHDTRDDCTKPTPECPSWGNQFRDNHLSGNYSCEALSIFKYYQDDSATGCSPPSSDARRLRTSGNTRAATPCG